jgi:hypothetical protein
MKKEIPAPFKPDLEFIRNKKSDSIEKEPISDQNSELMKDISENLPNGILGQNAYTNDAKNNKNVTKFIKEKAD